MKDYFRKLIQQTGVTFGPNSGLKPISYGIRPKGPQDNNKTNPIHVEERKLIEPGLDGDENERFHVDVDKTSAAVKGSRDEITQHSTGHQSEKGLINHREVQRAERVQEDQGGNEITPIRVSEKLDVQQPIEGNGDKGFIQAEQKSKVFESKIQPPLEKLQVQHEINKEGLVERKGTRATDTTAKEPTVQPGKSVDSTGQDSDKTTPSEFGIRSENRKAFFKNVREWVAEMPVADGEGIRDIEKMETKDAEKVASERERFAPHYSKSLELHRDREPQIHDFHLSVGTISLTVEGPQKEIQSNKPVQIRRDERTTKESTFSRLSRHYIRI
jgi:hypothetical protein